MQKLYVATHCSVPLGRESFQAAAALQNCHSQEDWSGIREESDFLPEVCRENFEE